jgi:CrcB protein
MNLAAIAAVAAGGALGSVLRYGLSLSVHAFAGRGFPWGTFAVNVLGCFAMGILFVVFMDRLTNSTVLRAGVLIGVLGGFTTFSSFTIETINLIEEGAHLKALVNAMASLLVCVAATWVGVVIGRNL